MDNRPRGSFDSGNYNGSFNGSNRDRKMSRSMNRDRFELEKDLDHQPQEILEFKGRKPSLYEKRMIMASPA